jgi:hypothetical protein
VTTDANTTIEMATFQTVMSISLTLSTPSDL